MGTDDIIYNEDGSEWNPEDEPMVKIDESISSEFIAKVMNPQRLFEDCEGPHHCSPCMTEYEMVMQEMSIPKGSDKDPKTAYIIWKGTGVCDSCAREFSGYHA